MDSGELTEDFDQALILDDRGELENELSSLDDPNNFEAVEVVVSVEV